MADWPTLRNQISEENRQRNEKIEKNPFCYTSKTNRILIKAIKWIPFSPR